MSKAKILTLLIILISFVLGFYFSSQLPDRLASHWNIRGEVDGYSSKFVGLYLSPIIMVGLFLLFSMIPRIDPLGENIKVFRKYYEGFMVVITLFLFYIYTLTILWNIGFRFDMGQLMIPALAGLFYYTAILIEHAKRNWFIGIRTPWTLSSDRVWEKTHKTAGKLLKISSLIMLLGIIFKGYLVYLLLFPIFLSMGYAVVYSYFEYKKEATS